MDCLLHSLLQPNAVLVQLHLPEQEYPLDDTANLSQEWPSDSDSDSDSGFTDAFSVNDVSGMDACSMQLFAGVLDPEAEQEMQQQQQQQLPSYGQPEQQERGLQEKAFSGDLAKSTKEIVVRIVKEHSYCARPVISSDGSHDIKKKPKKDEEKQEKKLERPVKRIRDRVQARLAVMRCRRRAKLAKAAMKKLLDDLRQENAEKKQDAKEKGILERLSLVAFVKLDYPEDIRVRVHDPRPNRRGIADSEQERKAREKEVNKESSKRHAGRKNWDMSERQREIEFLTKQNMCLTKALRPGRGHPDGDQRQQQQQQEEQGPRSPTTVQSNLHSVAELVARGSQTRLGLEK